MRDSKDPYKRRFTYPKWNGTVTVLEVHQLFNRLPEFRDWTKAQHIAVATEYLAIAHVTERMYDDTIRRMLATFGDGTGVLVSGVIRDHFPETVKTDLRTLAHAITEYRSRSVAHWQYAGKRIETWRRLNEQR